MNELAQRVITIAESWIGTPYHHMGTVRGAGCDCATLLWCVYSQAQGIQLEPIPYYPIDWHMHRSQEIYMTFVRKYAVELCPTDDPKPADIMLFQYGRAYSHGAIVVDWPTIIHAMINLKVSKDSVHVTDFAKRPKKLFRMRALL